MEKQKEPYNEDNLIPDFFKEMDEKAEILKQPINGLTMAQYHSVEQSELSKRIHERYKNMSLIEFLNQISVKD